MGEEAAVGYQSIIGVVVSLFSLKLCVLMWLL